MSEEWHTIIENQRDLHNQNIHSTFKIQNAMQEYLLTVAEEKDTTKILVRYESDGTVKLHILEDLLNLEQISDFCKVFNLDILFVNRCVIENYVSDTTEVRYKYCLHVKKPKTDGEIIR